MSDYDEEGNYVITVDSELGMVNVNDMCNGDNVYGMGVNANIFWGWGMTGFGGWSGGGGSPTAWWPWLPQWTQRVEALDVSWFTRIGESP